MVIKKAIYVWVIGILGMISFAACSTASQGEAPSTSNAALDNICLLYTSPSPRDRQKSRMPSSA